MKFMLWHRRMTTFMPALVFTRMTDTPEFSLEELIERARHGLRFVGIGETGLITTGAKGI